MLVVTTDEAERDFDELALTIQDRIVKIYVHLADWPKVSGVKTLTGQWRGCWRIRTGDYRVIFRVEDDRVIVVRIAHRREVYDA